MRLLVFALLLALGACTLITSFNPEGQPCDTSALPQDQCLTGFHCENKKCVKGAADGGP